MAENTVLEVQELTREFTRRGKPFAAVDHVDFRLDQGEFVAIVGRSGNGKKHIVESHHRTAETHIGLYRLGRQ